MKNLIPFGFLVFLLVGCSVGPDYQRPRPDLPERLRGDDPSTPGPDATTSLADLPWWEVFGDEQLVELVGEALARGHDVRLAAARVEEARARAGVAAAARWPAVDGGFGGSRGRESRFLGSGVTDELYEVRLGVSWEIDLWGRLRHLDQVSRSRLLAADEARNGVHLTLVSEVATSYFRLLALDRQLEIAGRTVDAFAETHSLFERRQGAGLASGLETASAEASLAATAARVPELERRIFAEENRLSVLLGRAPGAVVRSAAFDSPSLPTEVPAGIPADLLRRRPDLREAEAELRAANAEVGVATAELFPRLSLTGAFGGVAPELSELLSDGERWSVGGGLLTPLLQGRRLQNQRRAAVARWEQAQIRWEAAVYRSLAEVSTAIESYRRLAEAEVEQSRAVVAAGDAVRAARSRYGSGLADYFEVLRSQQELFPAERDLAQLRFERLAALVELYRALGGGWQLPDDDWLGADVSPAGIAP